MDMIAASRLRRVERRAMEGRPYAERLAEILGGIVPAVRELDHPLMRRRPLRRAAVLAISGERGLCGGYNANVMERASAVRRRLAEEGAEETVFYVVGQKGADYLRRRSLPTKRTFPQPDITLPVEEVLSIAERVISDYRTGEVDRVDLVYTAFESVGRYGPRDMELLPIEPPAGDEQAPPYRFEPDAPELLGHLLPLYIELSLYRALVESMAGEQAARMVAMHNATDSADKMIRGLTKTYNRARQSSITTEILEVVAGAEALLHGEE
jgi:F-type H+-transporting ATPase subunit gamma